MRYDRSNPFRSDARHALKNLRRKYPKAISHS